MVIEAAGTVPGRGRRWHGRRREAGLHGGAGVLPQVIQADFAVIGACQQAAARVDGEIANIEARFRDKNQLTGIHTPDIELVMINQRREEFAIRAETQGFGFGQVGGDFGHFAGVGIPDFDPVIFVIVIVAGKERALQVGGCIGIGVNMRQVELAQQRAGGGIPNRQVAVAVQGGVDEFAISGIRDFRREHQRVAGGQAEGFAGGLDIPDFDRQAVGQGDLAGIWRKGDSLLAIHPGANSRPEVAPTAGI